MSVVLRADIAPIVDELELKATAIDTALTQIKQIAGELPAYSDADCVYRNRVIDRASKIRNELVSLRKALNGREN